MRVAVGGTLMYNYCSSCCYIIKENVKEWKKSRDSTQCHLSDDAVRRAHTRVLCISNALRDCRNNTHDQCRQIRNGFLGTEKGHLAQVVGDEETRLHQRSANRAMTNVADCELFAEKFSKLKVFLSFFLNLLQVKSLKGIGC